MLLTSTGASVPRAGTRRRENVARPQHRPLQRRRSYSAMMLPLRLMPARRWRGGQTILGREAQPRVPRSHGDGLRARRAFSGGTTTARG